MQPEKIRSMIDQARNAWISEKAEDFAVLFSSNGEFIVPGNCYIGPEKIAKAARDFFAEYSSIKIEIQRLIIDGNQAVVEWTWQETQKSTGNSHKAEDAIVVDFQADQISRWREYIDTQTPKHSSSIS